MPKLKTTFKNVPENVGGDFGLLPIGRYPVRMHVDAYEHDGSGLAKGLDGEPVFHRTNAGDEMWKLELEVLDPKYKGRKVFDQFSFGEGGLKRVWVVWSRAGFVSEDQKRASRRRDA